MNAALRKLIHTGVAILLTATTAHAAGNTDTLLQRELQQQQIRTSTQRVAEQLGQLIGEFERNGIGGEDLKVLQAIQSVLWNLTDKEMERVVNLLQSARTAGDNAAAQRNVLHAFSGQKNITIQLRQLLVEYQRQQVVSELAARFLELSTRQGANLRETTALAQWVQNKTLEQLEEGQKSSLDLQTTEQQALRDETRQILQKLTALAKDASDERPRTALKQADEGKLPAVLDAAIGDLTAAKMLSAAGNQKIARDQLRALARLLGPPKDALAAMRQAVRELDLSIQTERQIIEQTKPLIEHGELPAMLAVAATQADNVDRADLVQHDLRNLAPVPADLVGNAIASMQEARSSLDTKNAKAAVPTEAKALESLLQGRQALAEQIAKAEAEQHKDTDAVAKLRELEKLVRALMTDQEALKQQCGELKKDSKAAKGLAPRQDDLEKRTQEAQRQAAPVAEPAAQSLADAAANMAKAGQALGKEPDTVDNAQTAALLALNKALDLVRVEIAKLEQAEKELLALEALLQKLAGIIQEQQKLELATATAASSPTKAPPLRQLATNQQDLANNTETLRAKLPEDGKAADPHLAAARQDMTDAKAQLDKAAPKDATPKQEQSLANLYKAKAAIEQLKQELAAALGETNAVANAQAAALLAQAQEQVAQAQDQLNQAGAGQMQQLQQQQQQIAEGLAQQAQAQPANPAVAQAQQAAQQAAAQLGENNLPGAVQAMQQAQAGMQQAMQAGQQAGQQPGQPAGQQPGQPAGQPAGQQAGQPAGQPPGQQAAVPGQSMPQLAQQQAEALAAAQQLAAQQQAAAAQAAMQQAAQSLQNAAAAVGAAAAAPGATPPSAAAPMQAAQGALSDAAAAAAGSPANAAAASASAAAAQAAMAQAQAAMGMAAAGMGQGQGQEQGPGTGDGMGNRSGGPQDGQRVAAQGKGQFIGLPARDRAAIQQSQSEKYPEEYGGMIEQYMKNLADQTAGGEK